mgnify:CR=1 FL=1
MISDPKFNTAREWFEKLRANLIDTIQEISVPISDDETSGVLFG